MVCDETVVRAGTNRGLTTRWGFWEESSSALRTTEDASLAELALNRVSRLSSYAVASRYARVPARELRG